MIDIAGAVAVEGIDEASRDQPDPAHVAAGVRGVAAHYGDPLREQRTLDTAVGLVDRSHRGVIAVPGRGAGQLAAHDHLAAPERAGRR